MKMPVLFLGHGSPMNALADNAYSKTLNALGPKLPRPRAILMVSAHWLTPGTWVTNMDHPKTIHDFHGFPDELFQVQYPAKGDKGLAQKIINKVTVPKILPDEAQWGLDHGAWSVLKHLYPQADIPVVQLSINDKMKNDFHFELGRQLRFLRDEGVLIIGSGNIVHNLRKIRWEENAKPIEWAVEFDSWVKDKLLKRDFQALQSDVLSSLAGQLSVPTPDHYWPLLYVLGATEVSDSLQFIYEEIQNGSISMMSVLFGARE